MYLLYSEWILGLSVQGEEKSFVVSLTSPAVAVCYPPDCISSACGTLLLVERMFWKLFDLED